MYIKLGDNKKSILGPPAYQGYFIAILMMIIYCWYRCNQAGIKKDIPIGRQNLVGFFEYLLNVHEDKESKLSVSGKLGLYTLPLLVSIRDSTATNNRAFSVAPSEKK